MPWEVLIKSFHFYFVEWNVSVCECCGHCCCWFIFFGIFLFCFYFLGGGMGFVPPKLQIPIAAFCQKCTGKTLACDLNLGANLKNNHAAGLLLCFQFLSETVSWHVNVWLFLSVFFFSPCCKSVSKETSRWINFSCWVTWCIPCGVSSSAPSSLNEMGSWRDIYYICCNKSVSKIM